MSQLPSETFEPAGTADGGSPPSGIADPWADADSLRVQLIRSVRRVCPSWLADRAEDIVEAALIHVVEGRNRRGTNDPVAASYLCKVAYTATIDEIRRVRREREVPLEEALQAGTEPATASDPAGDESLRRLGCGIRDCLERMVEPRRLAVGLHLLGHGSAEISKLTGWDGRRSRNMLHRGMGDLRACLTTKGLAP